MVLAEFSIIKLQAILFSLHFFLLCPLTQSSCLEVDVIFIYSSPTDSTQDRQVLKNKDKSMSSSEAVTLLSFHSALLSYPRAWSKITANSNAHTHSLYTCTHTHTQTHKHRCSGNSCLVVKT